MKQKNTGLIIKSKLTEKFTTIPNSVINDPNLTWKAKGILCKLLSNKSDWAVYKSSLQQFASDGRDSTTAGFNELVEKGYIVAIRRHNEKGQFAGYDYIVYDEPITEQPITEEPITENPISVKPSLINTNLINTNIINTNIKNTNYTGTSILDKRELKNIICTNLNLRTEQFKILFEENFHSYWDKEKLDANLELINEYKKLI